jgi:hypothetical protein
VLESILSFAQSKQSKDLKKTDGSKKERDATRRMRRGLPPAFPPQLFTSLKKGSGVHRLASQPRLHTG